MQESLSQSDRQLYPCLDDSYHLSSTALASSSIGANAPSLSLSRSGNLVYNDVSIGIEHDDADEDDDLFDFVPEELEILQLVNDCTISDECRLGAGGSNDNSNRQYVSSIPNKELEKQVDAEDYSNISRPSSVIIHNTASSLEGFMSKISCGKSEDGTSTTSYLSTTASYATLPGTKFHSQVTLDDPAIAPFVASNAWLVDQDFVSSLPASLYQAHSLVQEALMSLPLPEAEHSAHLLEGAVNILNSCLAAIVQAHADRLAVEEMGLTSRPALFSQSCSAPVAQAASENDYLRPFPNHMENRDHGPYNRIPQSYSAGSNLPSPNVRASSLHSPSGTRVVSLLNSKKSGGNGSDPFLLQNLENCSLGSSETKSPPFLLHPVTSCPSDTFSIQFGSPDRHPDIRASYDSSVGGSDPAEIDDPNSRSWTSRQTLSQSSKIPSTADVLDMIVRCGSGSGRDAISEVVALAVQSLRQEANAEDASN